jgi:hypothetical protein
MLENAARFNRGDFVRLKRRPTGSVGVVWQVQPKSFASVIVCWREMETNRIQEAYDPNDLALVPAHESPEYTTKLKENLGL